METYEELFIRLESEINLANENNQPLELCSKINELIDLHLKFGFSLMSEWNYSTAVKEFDSAGEELIRFKNCYQKIFDSEIFDVDSQVSEKLKTLYQENELKLLVVFAYSHFSTAMLYNINRNPALAASYFEKAEESFNILADQTDSVGHVVFSKYCNALKYFCEGLECFFRAGFSNARTKCQQAKILLGKIIETDLEQLKGKEEYMDFYNIAVSLFGSDYQTIKSYYFISEAKYQFNNRNFKSAAKQFMNVVNEFDFSLNNYLNSINNEIIVNMTKGEYHHYMGWKILAEAEVYRESESWEKAFDNYEVVKNEWEEASSFYLSSGHPSAFALQETVLNESSIIDVYQAVCENEKQLKGKISALQTEIDELKDKLFNAIKPMGIIVNNTQDVVNSLEQNTQFIQNIEKNAREGIKELLEVLKASGLDEISKKKIESEGAALLESKDKGHKFLEKAKSFTKDVGDIVKNVGDIASPLLSAYKFLALLM